MARGLASLGVEFSEEAVEEVTGYRVDMLLHCGDDLATGRCAMEVGTFHRLSSHLFPRSLHHHLALDASS